MSDKPQDATLVGKYRETVIAYEEINSAIQQLLTANDGGTVKMSDEEYLKFRDMARRRDVLYDMMKRLEVQLLGDDEG
ncbi:hypothetical protein ACFLYO_09215 [Chloroflexota bacterium]